MNKIFKTLKNHRTGAATAVSELQTGRTKGSRLKAVVVAAVAAAATLSSGVEAATWDTGYDVILNEEHDEGTSHVRSGFAFGNKNLDLAAKTYDEHLTVLSDIFDPYVFRFKGLDSSGMPTVKLELDDPNAMSLFEQSRGFDQALVHAKRGLSVHLGAYFSVDAENGIDSNIFEQLVEQNKETVARGRYIIGTRAQNLKFLDENTENPLKGYKNGIKYDDTTFYTAAVLSELDIYYGETLQLGVSGKQNWGAHLTGEGGVAYVGDNKAADVVTIKQLFESDQSDEHSLDLDRLHLANDYKGATSVTGVKLNLERQTSLGNSGSLIADDANIVEINEGALGTLDTIRFKNTDLKTADTSLTVADATFEGANVLNVVDSFKVGRKATITSGSLSTGAAAFEAGTLEIADAALTASAVKVNGNATVSGTNTVTANAFTTNGLTLNANATLDASGNLTAQTADLVAGSSLTADGDVTVTDQLTMRGSAIDATRFTTSSSTLTGKNTISTTNGATFGGGLSLSNGTSLAVTAGGLTANGTVLVASGSELGVTGGLTTGNRANVTVGASGTLRVAGDFTANASVTVESGADLNVQGGLSIANALTLETFGLEENAEKTNFFADRLTVGRTLAFEGESSSDNLYKFGYAGMQVAAPDQNSSYNVTLTNANVEYLAQLHNVGTTTLEGTHLTVDYDNATSLGTVTMQGGHNLVTFKDPDGGNFVVDNRFTVASSSPEDVIEFSGTGEVTFAPNIQADDKYKGWLRMTGTTLNLPLATMPEESTGKLSLSVGEGGKIAVSSDQQIALERLGWAETEKDQKGGTLDLSNYVFDTSVGAKPAITVQGLTVNGNGTIILDDSAVQGITVGTGDEGGSIFDALKGSTGTLVISVAPGGFDPEAAGGNIKVVIEGDTNGDEELTGYFNGTGHLIAEGDQTQVAAAKGTWGYGTDLDEPGLYVTHALTGIELLEGQKLALAVDGNKDQYQGVRALLTGTGTLEKTGVGTLHLINTGNTWRGATRVTGGTLVAEAGALGTGDLTVAGGGQFVLSGAQDEKIDQTVGTLTVEDQGLVRIGGSTTNHALVLAVTEGGELKEGSQLEGREDAVLAVTGGTLEVTDLELVAQGYDGRIYVGDDATLSLKSNGATSESVKLSQMTGSGTILVNDKAEYDPASTFTGLTQVAGGELLISAGDAYATQNANLGMSSGKIVSDGEHHFNSIDLTGGVLDVGKVQAGDDIASGALYGKTVNLDNVEIQVAVESEPTVDADNILEIDNVEGKDTWLVKGDKVTTGKITITGLDDAKKDSDLVQDGKAIGQLHYAVKQNPTDKGVSFNTKADSLTLDGTLKLEGALEPTADTTLDLAVDGNGTINVTSQTVTIAQANEYGALEVDRNATVNLDATQTLTQGGRISGNVNGDAGLNVTGGTLTVNGMDEDGFAVRVGSEATLAFEDLKGSSDIFKGAVTADAGSTVSFSNTTGDFNLASGEARYALTNGSTVTFKRTVADGAMFSAGSVSVDKQLSGEKVETWSTAIFDITGKAGKVDLSGVSGAGRIVLDYEPSATTGTLDVTAIGDKFTGQLAFTNALATIGTDETSTLNDFATKQGSLWVGAGSVLSVNNTKVPAEEGAPVTPNPVKLAGDLTVSDVAVLDFTKGINSDSDSDPGDGYLGNTSGISVNAIDMQNHKLVVADNGPDDLVTVRVDLDRVDISSGFPSGGDINGSILDLMAGTETSPVLTLIQGIDATDEELKSLASDMRLASDETSDTVVEFWQPGWAPNGAADKVHVANVHAGVRLVADTENNGIAVGAGITQIDILSGATLRMDASVSTGGATDVDASITGEDDKVKVLVTNNLGTAPTEAVKFLAENTYTGETVIDLGAKAVAGHASAFASSKVVRVGTMEKDQNGNPLTAESTLVLETAQVKGSAYVNAVKMKAIELGANGNLVIANENDLLLTGSGTSTFADGATVTGDTSTSIGLADGELNIVNLNALSGFKGDFRVNTGASVNFTVADGQDYTWSHDVLRYTDENARAVGAGEFVKSGTGTLVIGSKTNETTPDLSGMNLVVAEGKTELNNATLLGLTTRTGAVVDVNGIFTTANLAADAGSVFKLDVETGKTVAVKEGETAAKKPVWGLGERGDGIRVTGTASGTLNLAVTPKNVDRGAEESIQLVDANRAGEGFTVNLVDATGAKLEALTAGAYDYTLVRKDDAQNGTDVFLSSIIGDDEIRNTTVNAGSYLGVAAAAQLFDISLHDRMSNRSWLTANADGSIANSFWMLETVSNERYGDSTGQIDVHDTASTTTVGSDILSGLAAGGTWYAGAMFSYATEDTKSRSNRTALESRADTDAWAAGLYAGWQLNGADRTGPYVDGWILWTDAESDVKGVNVSETVDGNGLSASIEAGWGFKALSYNAHGQAGDIYVEPHVSVTWFGYEADDVSNDAHDVTFEGKDNIRTKLGVKTYAFGKNSGGFSPYVELNWIHNTETYGVTMSNVTVEQVGAEDQGEVRAGADWRINDAFTVWGHFGITSGSDGYSNREASLGVRYNF